MNMKGIGKIEIVLLVCIMLVAAPRQVVNAENRAQTKEVFRIAENSSNWESEDYKALQRAFYESPSFQGFTDEQLHAIRAEIRGMIHQAEILNNEGNDIEALRLLFDARYKEQRVQLLLGVDGTEQFPSLASEALDQLGTSVFQEDQSSLGHLFRDPEFPIREKRQYIADLRDLAATSVPEGEQVLFHGKDGGIIVHLMTSPRLSEGEKFHLLWYIETPASATQQERIREEIDQLRREAEQKLQAQQYVEAFLLIEEAQQKADDILLFSLSYEDDLSLSKQSFHMREVFIQSDESPLMQLFKSRLTSSRKKQRALSVLHKIRLQKPPIEMITLLFEGKEYRGHLVHIMSHPKLSDHLKYSLCEEIKTLIETWHSSPIP